MEKIKLFLYIPWSELEDAKNGKPFWAYTTSQPFRVLAEIPHNWIIDPESSNGEEVQVTPVAD